MTDTTNPPAQGQILRPSELPTISRAKGVVTQPLVHSDRGSTSLTIGISTFQPGAVIRLPSP
ncbi:MAG: hypothetical protein EBU62_04730 [Proteobacteria bacterium]|nr:hypothetical protein [Pseudomonadota bacterium]